MSELEEKKMTEADGRTGADASDEILSPRQTTVDLNGEKLHTLDSGEETHFELYVENIGDVDIEAIIACDNLCHVGDLGHIPRPDRSMRANGAISRLLETLVDRIFELLSSLR